MDAMRLLKTSDLQRSPVVANCAMNRERWLNGGNSYSRDLNVDILSVLRERRGGSKVASWTDLCCGSGRALIQAAGELCRAGEGSIEIIGLDLVGYFDANPHREGLTLLERPVESW